MSRAYIVAVIVYLAVLASGIGAQAASGDARSLYLEGREAQAQSNMLRAIELYRSALRENPVYSLPLIGLAECFFHLGEHEEALEYAQGAKKLERDNLELLVLEGRIRIGLGELDQARLLFGQVLSIEKNNLEAQFGLAELDIATGQRRSASLKYLEALKIRPDSQKALISLALLNESEGDRSAAQRYLELALRFHSSDPKVRYAAARLAFEQNDLERAQRHLETALTVERDFFDARLLLAQVLLAQRKSELAVETLQSMLDEHRDNPLLWYVLGLAHERLGNFEQALTDLARAVRLSPEDEVARITQESIALEHLEIKSEERKRIADYHRQRAKLYEERNILDKALNEYRRCLRLDPESKEGRLAYAAIYRIMGFPVKYQKELEVLRQLGYKDEIILDDIEIVQSQLFDSVATEWNIDQYALERKTLSIAVFCIPQQANELHPFAAAVLTEYLKDQLRRFDTLSIAEAQPLVEDYEEAFSQARNLGSDYFLLLHFEESERTYFAELSQYFSGTGRKLASYRAFRTGNDRIQEATILLASQLHSALPVWGTLTARLFDKGLVDLGKMDGIKSGDELIAVKKGKVKLRNDVVGFVVAETDVVADFKVSRPDERIAEGTLTKRSFFDFINPGDELIYPPGKPAEAVAAPVPADRGFLRRLYRVLGF